MKLKSLKNIVLLAGKHETADDGMCAMEAAAFIAGEPFTDHPKCVCPVIGAFMRSWNDSIQDNDDRTALLAPLIPLTIGTANGRADSEKRAFLCMDWLIREFTPTWIDRCSDQYAKHTAMLRSLPSITDWDGLVNATPILVDLQKQAAAAWDAAWDASWAAAWDAARASAWAAAWDAARASAWAAAWDAARASAWDAARDAAWASARASAWAAARDAAWAAARASAWDAYDKKLTPIKKELQRSAQELVRKMCAVGDHES